MPDAQHPTSDDSRPDPSPAGAGGADAGADASGTHARGPDEREEPGVADDAAPAPSPFERVLGTEPRRARPGVARRRGRVIGEGGVVESEEDQGLARVRSSSEEAGRDDVEEEDDDALLDASGAVIAGHGGDEAASTSPPTGAGSEGAHGPGAAASGADPAGMSAPPLVRSQAPAAAFLALAVRSYLDGVDRHGIDAEISRDRLARLRETLAVYDATLG